MSETIVRSSRTLVVEAKAFGDGSKKFVIAHSPRDGTDITVNLYSSGGALLSSTVVWQLGDFYSTADDREAQVYDLETLNDGNIILAFMTHGDDGAGAVFANIYYVILQSDGTVGTITLAKSYLAEEETVFYIGVGAFGDGTSVIYYQDSVDDLKTRYTAINSSYAITGSGDLVTHDSSPRDLGALALSNGKVVLGYGALSSAALGPGAVLGILSDATTFSTALFATALTARTNIAIGELSDGNIIIASSQLDAATDGYAIYQQDNTEVLGATLVSEAVTFTRYISRIDSDKALLMWSRRTGGVGARIFTSRIMKVTEAGVLVDSIATVHTGIVDTYGGVDAIAETPDKAYVAMSWNEPTDDTAGIQYMRFIGGAMPYWGVPPVDIVTFKRLVVAANNKIWYESI